MCSGVELNAVVPESVTYTDQRNISSPGYPNPHQKGKCLNADVLMYEIICNDIAAYPIIIILAKCV